MDRLIIQEEILIDRPSTEVWDALINPSKTKLFMFGCEAVSDWKVGSTLLWNAEVEGKTITYVSGTIREFKPVEKMIYTTFDPHADMEDIPENHIPVTYQLSEKEDQTLLRVVQGDFAKAAQGRKRYEDTMAGGGWAAVLENIKKVVEG